MSTLSFKCPSCGAGLKFTPGTDSSTCEYCSSTFTLEELEESVDENVAQDISEKEVSTYHCESCGAEVITSDTTTASFCYYCHNPVIMTKRLSGNFRPDVIIPFSFDRELAKKKFVDWAKTKKFVRKDFYSDSQLEKITGVYLPYWLADITISGDFKGVGSTVSESRSGDTVYTTHRKYKIDRHADVKIKNIFDYAYKKYDKDLISNIFPYRDHRDKPFKMAYLSGFFSEAYDIEREEVEGDMKGRFERYTSDYRRVLLDDYSSVSLDKDEIDYKVDAWKYALYPVWILTYHYRNKVYVYAVNGQTGKACGELPVDNKKLSITSIIIFLIIFALVSLAGYFLW